MEETLFAWVHLSDIHVGHGDPSHRWDQQLVLQEIARDVAAAPRAGLGIPAPHAVLVTGDVAFSGNGVVRAPDTESREYARARAWLLDVAGKLGLGARDVFVVPGNHDVDRGKDRDRNTGRLVRALQGGDSLDEALASADDRRLLAARMGAYLAFAADLAPACLAAPAPAPEQRLWWQHRLARGRDLTVRLVGLNTALLCSGDEDLGHLRLGNEQIARTFNEPPITDAGELVIALSHHPLREWLADAVDAERLLRRYAHLHLSGHVHGAESEEIRTGGGRGGFLRVVAGASHAERQASREVPAGHGYNFAAIIADESGALRLRIWPRRWSDQNRDFRPDVEHIAPNQNFAEHTLSVRCSPAQRPPAPTPHETPYAIPARPQPEVALFDARPPSTTPAAPLAPKPAPAGGAVKVCISFAPEDDTLCKELEKHLKAARLETSRGGFMEIWSKHKLTADEDPRVAMEAHLREADIILLLLSNEYLASDECYGFEMEIARQRRESRAATIWPVILRPTAILSDDTGSASNAEYAQLKSGVVVKQWFEDMRRTPRSREKNLSVPVVSWARPDEAFTAVVQDVRETGVRIRQERG